MARTLPPSHRPQLESALEFFRQYYREHLLDFSTLYPGVREILIHFQTKKMAVISNKPTEFTRAILAGLKVDKFFQLVLGGDSLPIMKPSPEPILYVLSELNVPPDRAVIIGDGATDIQAGKLAGILTCGVTYGFRSREIIENSQPDFFIDFILELRNIFT
jgi:phosphoglycolate phosphatase